MRERRRGRNAGCEHWSWRAVCCSAAGRQMGEHARTVRQRFRTAPSQPAASDPNEIGLATLAASADGIMAIDDRDTIRFGNHAAAHLLGQPATT